MIRKSGVWWVSIRSGLLLELLSELKNSDSFLSVSTSMMAPRQIKDNVLKECFCFTEKYVIQISREKTLFSKLSS